MANPQAWMPLAASGAASWGSGGVSAGRRPLVDIAGGEADLSAEGIERIVMLDRVLDMHVRDEARRPAQEVNGCAPGIDELGHEVVVGVGDLLVLELGPFVGRHAGGNEQVQAFGRLCWFVPSLSTFWIKALALAIGRRRVGTWVLYFRRSVNAAQVGRSQASWVPETLAMNCGVKTQIFVAIRHFESHQLATCFESGKYVRRGSRQLMFIRRVRYDSQRSMTTLCSLPIMASLRSRRAVSWATHTALNVIDMRMEMMAIDNQQLHEREAACGRRACRRRLAAESGATTAGDSWLGVLQPRGGEVAQVVVVFLDVIVPDGKDFLAGRVGASP